MDPNCVAVILTAGALSLLAATGVILIHQTGQLTGSVTPGDGPDFPVTITQPRSYRLTSNLVVTDANTTAIQITADFVTSDGSRPAGRGVRIRNGFVRGITVVETVSPSTDNNGGFGIYLPFASA